MRRTLFFALPALALTLVLALPDVSFAQRRGGGGFSSGFTRGAIGAPAYGGYGYGGQNLSYGLGYGLGSNLTGGGIGYGNYGYGNYGYGSGYGGWGYGTGYGWGSPGYYGGNYYGSAYPSNAYTWAGQPATSGWAGSSYQSFYPPTYGAQQGSAYGQQQYGQQQFNDGTRATIRVHVRPDAQVMFGGNPTQQMGPERVFITPPLEGNSNYSYQVTAKWRDQNGREETKSRTVRFSAGRTVDVDFMSTQNQQDIRPGTSGTEESEPAQPNSTTPRRDQNLTPQATPQNPGNATTPGTTRPPQPPQPPQPNRQPDR